MGKWKMKYCGASKEVYDRGSESEQYAYQFIHTDNPENLFPKIMNFDVIIGNPPYQLSDGGNKNSATPIYHLFALQAQKLTPKYLIMIIPSRWYCGGRDLKEFRDIMLGDGHVSFIYDYKRGADCFPGIRAGGGVCYFKWEKNYSSNEMLYISHEEKPIIRKKLEFGLDFFIRDNIARNVVEKVFRVNNIMLSSKVWSQKPFGFRTNFMDFEQNGEIKLYTKKDKSGFAYVGIVV